MGPRWIAHAGGVGEFDDVVVVTLLREPPKGPAILRDDLIQIGLSAVAKPIPIHRPIDLLAKLAEERDHLGIDMLRRTDAPPVADVAMLTRLGLRDDRVLRLDVLHPQDVVAKKI